MFFTPQDSFVETKQWYDFPKIAHLFGFENIVAVDAAIHLENWDFSRQMFFSDHQWNSAPWRPPIGILQARNNPFYGVLCRLGWTFKVSKQYNKKKFKFPPTELTAAPQQRGMATFCSSPKNQFAMKHSNDLYFRPSPLLCCL